MALEVFLIYTVRPQAFSAGICDKRERELREHVLNSTHLVLFSGPTALFNGTTWSGFGEGEKNRENTKVGSNAQTIKPRPWW